MMIKGLQGTMITGAGVMMTAERLILIMIDVGMIKTVAGMTEDATTKKNDSRTGHRGRQMVKDGLVEDKYGRVEKTDIVECFSLFFTGLSDLCGVVVYPERVLLYWLVSTLSEGVRNYRPIGRSHATVLVET